MLWKFVKKLQAGMLGGKMTTNPIKIEIVTNYISDIERIVEAVRKLRKSNPDEVLEVTIRVGLSS